MEMLHMAVVSRFLLAGFFARVFRLTYVTK